MEFEHSGVVQQEKRSIFKRISFPLPWIIKTFVITHWLRAPGGAALLLALALAASGAPAQTDHLTGNTPDDADFYNDPLAKGASLYIDSVWSGNSVGFAFLTLPNLQIAGYYNASRQLVLAARNLNSTRWYYQTNNTVFGGWDGHNYITMSLDPLGCLHLSGNMHNQPMTYFRSAQPVMDAAQFQSPGFMRQLSPLWNVASEARSTYPSWFTSPNQEFIFSYRNHIQSTVGSWYLLKFSTATWSFSLATGPSPLFTWINNYSVYPAFTVCGGYVHCLYMWRGSGDAASNYRLSYLRSSNLLNWTDAFGRAVTLPISTNASLPIIDDVPQGGGLLNGQPRLGFDRHGVPLVAYHKYDAAGHSQVYVARPAPGSRSWLIVQLTSAAWSWKFSGGGCLPPGGWVNNPFVRDDPVAGLSTVAVAMTYANGARDNNDSGNYTFEETTLKSVMRTHSRPGSHDSDGAPTANNAHVDNNVMQDPYTAPVSGDKMVINRLSSAGVASAGSHYYLRWEALRGDNRDKPKMDARGHLIKPTPSALMLCRTRADRN